MRFVTPWNLSKKRPHRQAEEASFPWRDTGRNPRSRRAGNRRAHPWSKLSGLIGSAIGRDRDDNNLPERSGRDTDTHGVTVDERADRVRVKVEVPPVDKSDLTVGCEGDTLLVSGRKRTRNGHADSLTEFAHEIRLGAGLDACDARARLKNGTLTVDIPRSSSRGREREPIRVE
jgi:HSP20 family molecular chaperone IbpA